MATRLRDYQQVTGTRAYDLVIDGDDGNPVTLLTDTPAGILCWAERQKINKPFEIRENGRRIAKLHYQSDVWLILP